MWPEINLRNRTKLYTWCCFIVLVLCSLKLDGQTPKILHYTETSGYDHLTRVASLNMFDQMGLQNGFIVDNDTTGDSFNSLSNLQQYSIVIFSNTTGDAILDSSQQQNFMQYINNGGSFIGIHSATDTYRHSTSNGSNTGSWDWYAELVGASVQQNPTHVNGIPVYNIETLISHPVVTGIPNPWSKAEEYYYWEGGYFGTTNTILQRVEQTVGPNGQVNSYDSARAVSWYRMLPSGGAVFYTSLGHDISNYTSDLLFYQLLENAVLWEINLSSGVASLSTKKILVFPNPFQEKIFIKNLNQDPENKITVFNTEGKTVIAQQNINEMIEIDLAKLQAGIYILELLQTGMVSRFKIIKQ